MSELDQTDPGPWIMVTVPAPPMIDPGAGGFTGFSQVPTSEGAASLITESATKSRSETLQTDQGLQPSRPFLTAVVDALCIAG